ncbi:hypothetical protein [Actinoallomurus iriomotensis]|uniref:Uncharacterized protein n=1 Tax=Actinoallomurus iriomotensis TaxID=478107 RepID=A0A9W6S9D0_9ACTN|nr:hypothetical protein [Actinoallomurus iriomotensis]GLY88090.1 hypothetical protein Airi02_060190 [Actinoallomurus iriomotensis]
MSTLMSFQRAGPGRPARRPGPRWPAFVLIGSGLALVPWLFVLAFGLPATAVAAHWSTAWVGFDSLEALGLITTGMLLRRRDPRGCLAAAATAPLPVVDAWFDVVTAAPGGDRAVAVAMAVFPELPLAVVCAVLAIRTLPRSDLGRPRSTCASYRFRSLERS